MGKGDKRTKRGKLFKGTYGNTRPRKKEKDIKTSEKPTTEKKEENKE